MSHYKSKGGIFEQQLQSGHVRDVSFFPTVGTAPWPPGPRSVVGETPRSHPIGFKNIGMGDMDASKPKAIMGAPQPMVPRSVVTGHVSAYNYGPAAPTPAGYTSKGGILDGSTVESGEVGRGRYFEEAAPRYIGTGLVTRSLPDRLASLTNIAQENITPSPRPISGFGEAAMPSRPIPVAVSFARPRMIGRSIFEGPVVRDHFPQANITPQPKSLAGFGTGPDGLGSSCGCGGWKSY